MNEKKLFTTIKPEICLAQLFQSRDIMHLAHLQTTSYATHKALQEYYEGILDLTDNLLETYMGTLGKRVNIKIPASEYINPESHLKYLKDYIGNNNKNGFISKICGPEVFSKIFKDEEFKTSLGLIFFISI